MKNKGFTLIEMICTVVLFMGILIITVPAIMNQVRDKKSDISESMLNTIYDAAKLYIDDYRISDDIESGSSYCVSLDELVKDEYLTSPVIDPVSRKEIPLTKYVKATLNPNGEFDDFKLVNSNCNN